MVTETEFAKAARDLHLAVDAARQAEVEVSAARWALEGMQCFKEFQLVVANEAGDDLSSPGFRRGSFSWFPKQPRTLSQTG
ncbi:hypothetical protein BANT10_02887 [Brevibacterium antiquum]|uniref:Uncharacterized protein n=1 Tax=Brevibacterium antiquum TaxID=234835 RepID=A0A2H1KBK1_9MICO|nr:hypothetical protein BANT10_02887 [Brevibacterium antiquum]